MKTGWWKDGKDFIWSTSETSSTVTTENVTGKATDWLDEADDWGDDNGNQGKLISL